MCKRKDGMASIFSEFLSVAIVDGFTDLVGIPSITGLSYGSITRQKVRVKKFATDSFGPPAYSLFPSPFKLVNFKKKSTRITVITNNLLLGVFTKTLLAVFDCRIYKTQKIIAT